MLTSCLYGLADLENRHFLNRLISMKNQPIYALHVFAQYQLQTLHAAYCAEQILRKRYDYFMSVRCTYVHIFVCLSLYFA